MKEPDFTLSDSFGFALSVSLRSTALLSRRRQTSRKQRLLSPYQETEIFSAKQKRDEFYRLFFVLWFVEGICKEKNDGTAIVRNEAQSRHGSDAEVKRLLF